jgi:hypothetical protein
MNRGVTYTAIAIVMFLAVLLICVVLEEWMNR